MSNMICLVPLERISKPHSCVHVLSKMQPIIYRRNNNIVSVFLVGITSVWHSYDASLIIWLNFKHNAVQAEALVFFLK